MVNHEKEYALYKGDKLLGIGTAHELSDLLKVKVDLQCPYCGFCKILKTASHRKGITCPTCQQTVFLSWATGIEGELDKYGYYFHAHEPFNIRKINQEFQGAFEEYTPKSFTIRNRAERR